ncbi:MAG: methionine gamma-lyase family protein, partial [Firmicutes bacterium]|nr:methionine gamma-lyase family protein [Bacillota bacterium]
MIKENTVKEYLIKNFDIDEKVVDFCLETEKEIKDVFENVDSVAEINQYKVLRAMQKNKLSDTHFNSTTGYGYNDLGRDTLEQIYADVFNAEDALVRPQIISGTHALTVALFGNLRYGDVLYSPVGSPYDTLEGVIGHKREVKGSLKEHGVGYDELPLLPDGRVDFDNIASKITEKTKLVTIQRSKGYCYRPSLTIEEIEKIIKIVKAVNKNIICMVDNCYGEFTDTREPIDVGADLIVGSLIKNPGGGLAPVGGYIVGKKEYVENAAYRLTSPGMGKEVGPSLGVTASLIQGLFLSPNVVSASIKGAVFASALYEKLGFDVMPTPREKRTDIVQSIQMRTPENVISFCRGIQKGAAVDSYVSPEPWDMPGYDCPVIMAAGAFVQGSSIELSADAPMKPPYTVYMQGGLTWHHAKIGIITAVNEMYKKGQI